MFGHDRRFEPTRGSYRRLCRLPGISSLFSNKRNAVSSQARHKSPENTVFSGLCFFAFCSTYGSTYFCIFEPKMYRGFPREPYGLWNHTALLAHFSTFFLQSIGKDAILWDALDNALFKSLLLTVIVILPGLFFSSLQWERNRVRVKLFQDIKEGFQTVSLVFFMGA